MQLTGYTFALCNILPCPLENAGSPLMSRFLSLAPIAACLLLSTPLFAADAAKGDIAAGHELAYTCHGCHGVTGYKNAYPNYHVPRITGQNYDYLVNALTEYKKGERAHPTMRAQGESLSDADIRNLSAYLASLNDAAH